MATLTKSTGTVALLGAVEKVTLPAAYGWVWIKNMSEGNIFAGLSEDISAGADGVLTISAGDAGRIQMDGQDSVYLLGSGNALVVAQNYADCPFKAGVKGGGSDVDGASSYTLTNAVDYPLLGLNLYGKSVQDGLPTPDNPVDIVSVGDSGTVNITSNNGGDISVSAAITSALPFCGIPVADGGNYTDSNGQQWVCDEVVYNADGTGKIVNRIDVVTLDGSENWYATNTTMTYCAPNAKWATHDELLHNDYRVISKYHNKLRIDKNYINVHLDTAMENYQTWLQNNPNDIFFVRKVPLEIPLTAAEMSALRQLQTYNGITNISNDGGADMDVSYCTNKMLSKYVMPITTGLQAQIDELKAAVLSLGGNV